jgi:hypothetical protein
VPGDAAKRLQADNCCGVAIADSSFALPVLVMAVRRHVCPMTRLLDAGRFGPTPNADRASLNGIAEKQMLTQT